MSRVRPPGVDRLPLYAGPGLRRVISIQRAQSLVCCVTRLGLRAILRTAIIFMLERHREAGSVSSLGSSAGPARSAGLVSMACSAGTALGAWGQGWSFSGNGWRGATNQGQAAIVSHALSNFVVAWAGAYPYMAHLTEFKRREDNTTVPAWLRRVATPLICREWGRDLHDHPDPDFRAYILRGIADGFRVGFSQSSSRQSATSNMRPAIENAAVVREYLSNEISLGRIIGPIDIESVPTGTQISPLGVVPKSSQPGKWRLIVDLSSPGSRSVNDGI